MKIYFYKTKCYSLKWQIVFNNNYKISECKKVINSHTCRVIKETVVGYTVGFWIGKRFIAKKRINDYVEIIPEYELEF